MRCQRKPDIVTLAGLLFLILVLIFVLMSNTGCAYESYIPCVAKDRPHNVNENPRPFYNASQKSHGDFFIEIGHEMNFMKSRGHRIYDVKVEDGRDMAGKYKIYVVWVYYD